MRPQKDRHRFTRRPAKRLDYSLEELDIPLTRSRCLSLPKTPTRTQPGLHTSSFSLVVLSTPSQSVNVFHLKLPCFWLSTPSSGDDRDRTGNLRLAKPALSQLSYVPVQVKSQKAKVKKTKLVAFLPFTFSFSLSPCPLGQHGFEPWTSALSGLRSSQLSYWPRQIKKPNRCRFGPIRPRLLDRAYPVFRMLIARLVMWLALA